MAGTTPPTAVACESGTYQNEVSSNTTCKACGGGLLTRSPGAKSASLCAAPPGQGWDGSLVADCANGTYKRDWAKRACTSCGTGFYTPVGNNTASTNCCELCVGLRGGCTHVSARRARERERREREEREREAAALPPQ
jgi:hypothetical protein